MIDIKLEKYMNSKLKEFKFEFTQHELLKYAINEDSLTMLLNKYLDIGWKINTSEIKHTNGSISKTITFRLVSPKNRILC